MENIKMFLRSVIKAGIFKALLSIILIGLLSCQGNISQKNSAEETTSRSIDTTMFRHHFIATDLPGDAKWGYGVSLFADIDNDGDPDYVTCVLQDSIYWFENNVNVNGEWARHTVGKILTSQLGSAIMDIDGDGWLDVITGTTWYQNPRNPRESLFKKIVYDSKIGVMHDVVTADVNGDGKTDIVVTGDKDGCFWYEIPGDPLKESNWNRHLITMDVLVEKDGIHGGFFPAGISDLDGDGDADIVLPDRWLENRNHGKEWIKHPLPFARKRGPWGLSSRSWIVDLDKDGFADIVMSDCDQKGSEVAWLENDGQHPPSFKPHFLKQEATGIRGSFHSLAVADFNGDGNPDIFVVDQEDPSILPSGAGPRWFIWKNMGTEEITFKERVIFDGGLGGHDARVGDMDGDGDLDIISKIWNRWPENSNGGREHVDWLENLLIK
ncbi:MAG: hypothetical protein A2X03_01010 [Bacteroidetes bacterium GWA2_40_15]|nr:MAG: hypothetical protein A2X03_01010 [Bacteroidetes bacterium GWA2_40_15]HBQ84362.1 hypothetical protein [Bacteroidales bacterium]